MNRNIYVNLRLSAVLLPLICLLSCSEKDENIKPSAESAEYSILKNAKITSTIKADDRDGHVVEYKVNVIPIRGSLTLDSSSGSFTYISQADYSGVDSFQVVVIDDDGDYSAPCVIYIFIGQSA